MEVEGVRERRVASRNFLPSRGSQTPLKFLALPCHPNVEFRLSHTSIFSSSESWAGVVNC